MSMRSSSGPEMRPTYRWICKGVQRHSRVGSFQNPQGYGLREGRKDLSPVGTRSEGRLTFPKGGKIPDRTGVEYGNSEEYHPQGALKTGGGAYFPPTL